MSETICDSCGERVVPGTQFCTNCGYFLEWNENEPVDDDRSAPETRLSTERPTTERPPTPANSSGSQPVPTRRERPTTDTTTAVIDERTRRPEPPPTRSRRPVGLPCQRCATPNESTRRFCSKCGLYIGQPSATDQFRAFTPPRLRWWQRWFRPRPGSERAARAAYRRSLPWWVRLRRVLIALVVVLLGVAYLRFVGRDPITWTRHVIANWRGTVVAVDGVTSASVTQSAANPLFPAKAATDKNSGSAWATSFSGPTSAPGKRCANTPTAAALQLTPPKQITMRAIMVQTGLTTPDRNQQWIPRTLDLTFSDGSCQRINVKNVPDPQIVRIHTVKTNFVRLVIVAADQPQVSGAVGLAAITETALLVRPN